MPIHARERTEEFTTEIRPGVLRPDWSAVTTLAARNALNGRMSERADLLRQVVARAGP